MANATTTLTLVASRTPTGSSRATSTPRSTPLRYAHLFGRSGAMQGGLPAVTSRRPGPFAPGAGPDLAAMADDDLI